MLAASELVGESRDIVALRERIAQLLKRAASGQRLPTILIEGETGTGKGVLARALHRQSPRNAGRLVSVNCAAIPETMLESEMFGHERGAFTDARQAKRGLFEEADGGTLFLDEVGLLPSTLQGKLLTAIEERSIRHLGSTRSQSVDVWVIAASNEDLSAAIRQNRFREDLYQRLAVLKFRLSPLRERGDDVPLLANHFLRGLCDDYKTPQKTLAPDARAALLRHSWPGNVRELANVMERAVLDHDVAVITAAMLALPDVRPAEKPREPQGLKTEVEDVERERIRDALTETKWNISRAAARLKLARNTLRYRMERLGLPLGRADDRARSGEPSGRPPAMPSAAPEATDRLHWERRRLALVRVVVAPAPESVATQAGRAIEVLVEKVRTFGGRLEETSDNGFVAVFGVEPTEDPTSPAAHASLALMRAAAQAEAEEGEEWTLRLGLHVGRFLVAERTNGATEIGPDGKRDTWPVLDTLVDRAGAGQILVSDAAASVMARRFELVRVEGGGPAKRIFRLVRRRPVDAASGQRMAAFVGRRHHLALLEGYLAATLDGRGYAVSITGEAGIGKSRLISEFRQRLTREPVTCFEGTCQSYASGIPYLPVLDIVRQICGISETDDAERIRERVERAVAAVEIGDAAAPYLLHLLGLRDGTEALAAVTSEAIKLRTIETLRQMMLHGARERPIVLVVEDLHWIDRASEEVISSLVDNVASVPVLFLSTYRPGYRPAWLERSYATQIALTPLSLEDGLAVIRSLLQSPVSDTVARAIFAKADGNPFFLEELCRTVAEGPSDFEAVPAVPDTIQEALLARIQRLPTPARRLLQTASVLGREVSERLLRFMWSAPEPLDTTLALLTSLEFLYARSDRGEPVYRFKHALTQEIAYDTLEPQERRALHAAAGLAFEEVYHDRLREVYDRLAYHYSRTDETAKAVEYLMSFAEKSARAYAHDEAVKALGEAGHLVERLSTAARDRKKLELAIALPASLLPLGRLVEIFSVLLEQRERLERVNDPALSARYYFLLSRAYILSRHDVAGEHARRAIAEAERCGDTATMGRAYGVLAMGGALSGQAARGIEHGRRAVTLLEKTDSQSSLCYAYWALGLCYSQTGAFEEAIEAESQALQIAVKIGDLPLEGSAAWVLGIIHAAMGDFEDGVAHCERAVQKARDTLNRAIATGFLGYAYLQQGDLPRAIDALEKSIPSLHQFGLRAFEAWFTALLAEAHGLAGHFDRAEPLSAQALQIAAESNFGLALGCAHQAASRVALARGDHDAATKQSTDALAVFTRVHARSEAARTHLDLATISRARGDVAAVRRHLTEAHALFDALEVPKYRERVDRLAAEWGTPLDTSR